MIMYIEIKGSDLKARLGHCAGALVLSSRLTEVIIFGGYNSHYNNYSCHYCFKVW